MNRALRVPDYLGHILAAMERIKRHTADVDEHGFLNSELIQDAVIRNIEIIGSGRISKSGESKGMKRNFRFKATTLP